MLMARSYSLQELADEFGVAKTTMHYHLATLRTAGLVLITSNDKEYSLRRNMLSDVSSLLETYLKGKEEQSSLCSEVTDSEVAGSEVADTERKMHTLFNLELAKQHRADIEPEIEMAELGAQRR